MKKFLTMIMLTGVLLLTVHQVCASEITPINDIITSPADFDGMEVKLKGVASDITRIPLLYLKSYVLKDDSGEITILTEAELPKSGEEIIIKAKVESFAIIRGESLGMMVIELERYPALVGI
jgi:hypothetical protein